MTGTYTLLLTSAVGCTNIVYANGSVTPMPVIIMTHNAPVCTGGQLLLNASGGDNYTWYAPNGFYATSQSVAINNIGSSAGGTYTLLVANGSCIADSIFNILVHSPAIPHINSNSPVCEGATAIMSSSGGSSYNWVGPNGFSSTSNPISVLTTSSSIGVYTLSVIDANSCVASATIGLGMLMNPVPFVVNDTVCMGESAVLTASGGVSYSWVGPSGYTSNSPFAFIPIANATSVGNYTVTVVGSNSCSTASIVILVGNPFPLPVPVVSGETDICLNANLSLIGSGGVSYLWTGPANFIANTQEIVLQVKEKSAGIYTLSVKNASNCAASATVEVKVNPLPTGNVVLANSDYCAPYCSDLRFRMLGRDSLLQTIKYKLDGKPVSDAITFVCFPNAGEHVISVDVTDANHCSSSIDHKFVVHPKPEADFSCLPLKPVANIDRVQFYNKSINDENSIWAWFIDYNYYDTINVEHPELIFTEAGVHPIVLMVTSEWGCMDTAMKAVFVNDEFLLYVPNVFTPNGDGLNDVFLPKGQGVFNYSMEIYSRWDDRVFHTNDMSIGWTEITKVGHVKTIRTFGRLRQALRTGNQES